MAYQDTYNDKAKMIPQNNAKPALGFTSDKAIQRSQGNVGGTGGVNNNNNVAGNTNVDKRYSITEKGLVGSTSNLLSDIADKAAPTVSSAVSSAKKIGTGVMYGKEGLSKIDNPSPSTPSGPVQIGGRLAAELNNLSPVKDYAKPSAFTVDPNNYAVSSGKGGNVMYTKNQDGSIAKVDLNTGSRVGLGNVSTIGQNGTNVDGSPLSPKDQAAMDRSNKMIQDWKEYKERKPLQDFITSNLGNPRASAHQMQMAESRLNALDKNKLEQGQIAANNQAALASVFQKQQAAEQAGRLGQGKQAIDYAKAREEATANTYKWITEAKDKGMTNPYSLTQLAKSRGSLTPEMFHYIHGDSLNDVTTPEEYDQWAADNKIPTEDALIGRQLYQ